MYAIARLIIKFPTEGPNGTLLRATISTDICVHIVIIIIYKPNG